MLTHFKTYIMIADVKGEKRMDLAYMIQGREVDIVSMFSDNVQYQMGKPVEVLLTTKEEMWKYH